jgi:hypothetical protein
MGWPFTCGVHGETLKMEYRDGPFRLATLVCLRCDRERFFNEGVSDETGEQLPDE